MYLLKYYPARGDRIVKTRDLLLQVARTFFFFRSSVYHTVNVRADDDDDGDACVLCLWRSRPLTASFFFLFSRFWFRNPYKCILYTV